MAALTPVNDRTIPHQEKVEPIIDKRVSDDNVVEAATYALRGNAVIASPIAPGAAYAQAEAASQKTAIDAILVALRAAKIIA